ncbi:MAG: hypothetical protein HKO89_08145, partial [Saprospiraceae bacterium]|nr:hypothetical protein [Saprospiraceae bacterium]
VLFIFSNGNWTIPIATWIAPVFLLAFLRHSSNPRSLILLFVLIIVSTKFMLAGIIPNDLGGLTYILTFYYAVIWFFPYCIHSIISHRIPGFKSTLVLPVAGVTAEYLNTIFFGSWSSLAYTQYGDLALMQICSITGIWGISFLILWFASVIDWCWSRQNIWDSMRSRAWIYILTLFLVLFYGGIRLMFCTGVSTTENIVSFTPTEAIDQFILNMKNAGFSSSRKMAKENRTELNNYLEQAYADIFQKMESITNEKTSLVLWPEATISVLEEKESAIIEKGKKFAHENNTFLIMAYYLLPKLNSSQPEENKLCLINSDGEIEFEYLKAYPVPGSPHKAGDKVIPFAETSMGTIGSVICYDMDFTPFINQAGRKKIDIMLVPAWDWEAINPLHAQMAVFRCIENGFSMVRQTGEGLSIASDPAGRVLSSIDHFTSKEYSMVSSVPNKRCSTIYALTGDLFAWLCISVFIVFILLVYRKKHND